MIGKTVPDRISFVGELMRTYPALRLTVYWKKKNSKIKLLLLVSLASVMVSIIITESVHEFKEKGREGSD